MRYSTLGRTGLQVSNLCLGTFNFGGPCDESETARIVGAAYENGINFFDSADVYRDGRSEMYLGSALASIRDQVLIGTKTGSVSLPGNKDGGGLSRRSIVRAVEGSLRRLGTDWIDVYYCHFEDPTTPLDETLAALTDLVSAGKILYPAVSNFPAWKLVELMRIADVRDLSPIYLTQNRYNLLHRDPERELLNAAAHLDIGVVAFSPLHAGVLTGKYLDGLPEGSRLRNEPGAVDRYLPPRHRQRVTQIRRVADDAGATMPEIAFSWLKERLGVTTMIMGARSVDQLRENIVAAEYDLPPGVADLLEGVGV